MRRFGGPGRKKKGCIQKNCVSIITNLPQNLILSLSQSQNVIAALVVSSKPTPTSVLCPTLKLGTSTYTTVTSTENQQAIQSVPSQVEDVTISNAKNGTSTLPHNVVSIQEYLQSQNRKVKSSRGDGNCLFRSFAFQLLGSEEDHIAVRTATLHFENLNQNAFTPYLTSLNKAIILQHIQHVLRPSVFGTHIEILALTTLFNVPTFYCCLSGKDQKYSWHCVTPLTRPGLRYPDLSGNPLENVQPPSHFELLYLHNIHFDSIVSAGGELCTDFPILSTAQICIDLS